MDFYILVGDMIQRIYENFLEILGMTKIYVASQPRGNRVIPLIEKEYSQEINIGVGLRWK